MQLKVLMVMRLFLNQDIKIQSISDIITNSSSEVFCRITSDDYLVKIADILCGAISSRHADPEIEPLCRLRYKDELYWYSDEEKANLPSQWVEIEVPYGWSGKDFYELALPAVLDKLIGNENYKIIYDSY